MRPDPTGRTTQGVSTPGVDASTSLIAASSGMSRAITRSAPAAVVAMSVARASRRWNHDWRTTQPMMPSCSSTVRTRVRSPLPTTR